MPEIPSWPLLAPNLLMKPGMTERAHPPQHLRGSLAASLAGSALTALILLGSSSSAAQELSGEVHVRGPGIAIRRSNEMPVPNPPLGAYDLQYAQKSMYLDPAIGFSLFPSTGHGFFAEAEYMLDLDADAVLDDAAPGFRIDLPLLRAGYVHRWIVPGPRRPDRRAHVFTVNAGLATGVARARNPNYGIPQFSPVIGSTVGVGYELHIQRFFMGFNASYDLLYHTRGVLHRSQIVRWNVCPLLRIGVDFGRRVQRAPD